MRSCLIVLTAIGLLTIYSKSWSKILPYPVCRQNSDCHFNEFCLKENCSISLGLCTPKPAMCNQTYNPVCACNGRTYSNICQANINGQNIAFYGECSDNYTIWMNLHTENNEVKAYWGSTNPEDTFWIYYAEFPKPRKIYKAYINKLHNLRVILPYNSSYYVAVSPSENLQHAKVSNIEYFIIKPIWQPEPGTTWQWQLTQPIDTSVQVDMIDVDLFDTPEDVIEELKRQGKIVICYFSAGTFENWREDAIKFPREVIGKPLKDWPGEYWLDIRRVDVLGPIIKSRLDLAVQKGCDGVEPDNVDAYMHDTGFPITSEHQLRYNIWLSEEAHKRGLSIGLKNDGDQANILEPFFDWALVEECFLYNECGKYEVFINKGKAVFEVEYELAPEVFCPKAKEKGFSAIKKNITLDREIIQCR